jgi:SAM-dependent methyltransferase
MQDFYDEVINQLLQTQILTSDMKILVICGGQVDRKVLHDRGFKDVVISNVDPRPEAEQFAPFGWGYQDAEHLTYDDASFDFCIVHSGLHHCYSPHRALLEMYRVASKGVVVFEPYDNLVTRAGVRFNIGQEFEHASVFYNNYKYGGVANTPIPNYIYRWTEREIVKSINCYAPQAPVDVRFIHKMRVPWEQLRVRRNRMLFSAIWLAQPALKLVELCFPKQSNSFAAIIVKPELPQALYPWLQYDGENVRLNEKWLAARFQRKARRSRFAARH